MKRVFTLLLLTSILGNLKAQSQYFHFAKSFKSSYQYINKGNDIVSDLNGNIYVTGIFTDTVDFDPGPGKFELYSNSAKSIFILKLDPNGNFDWVRSIRTNSQVDVSIAMDQSSQLYIAGSFNGYVDFDPSPNSTQILNTGGSFEDHGFILKLDTGGNFQWVAHLEGASNTVDIVCDNNNNIYTAGYFVDATDFDPGFNRQFRYSSGYMSAIYESDIFLQKLDSNGNFLWVRTFGDNYKDRATAIALDNLQNPVLTGFFKGNVDFSSTSSQSFTFNSNTNDVFILKLNATNGSTIWAGSVGGASDYDISRSIACDNFGNIYTLGEFWGTADLNPENGIFNVSSTGNYDIFLLKVTSSGSFQWVIPEGGSFINLAKKVFTDNNNNLYIVGQFSGSVNFSPSGVFYLSGSGNTGSPDNFLQILNSNGQFRSAVKITEGGGFEECNSISLDPLNNILLTGSFGGTCDFDPSTSAFSLIANSPNEIFLSKLSQNGPVGLNEKEVETHTSKVYPNPCKDILNINAISHSAPCIKIYDVSGKLVFQKSNIPHSKTVVEFIAKEGIYILELSSKNNKEYFKIIKE